ncbi:MAG: polysaccharide biosynthesis tyrosine autokinase [Thermogutta sp.]
MNEFSHIPLMVPDSATHVLQVAVQFAAAVRRHWHVVVKSVVAAAILGGLYYATATRFYASRAEILILQTGDNPLSTRIESQSSRDNTLMPTFVNLIKSQKVLEGAIRQLSPEDCAVDLNPEKPERWPAQLQAGVTASSAGRSNIITVEYRSRDPEVAARVVNAVVQSYLNFMKKTTEGTTAEILQMLHSEKDQIALQLSEKEQALQQLSQEIGALDGGVNSQAIHPLVERARSFNAALVEAQKTRLDLEATLRAIEVALRQGQDIRQYLLGNSDDVSQQLLLGILGFDREESVARANLEKQLLDDQVELARLQNYLGSNHPRVRALQQRIAATENYLYDYRRRLQTRLAALESSELADILLGAVRQRLEESLQKEYALQAQYEMARQQAAALAGGLAQMEMLKNDIAGLRELYSGLVRRITSMDLTSDLRAALVSEPVPNLTPVSPNLFRVVVMVLFGGMMLGFMAVYVMDVLDDRFRNVEEIQWQLRAPVLSVVREMPAREGKGIQSLEVAAEPESAASEAFRTLRTALALSETPAESVVITSTQPGDGKSTVAANLAVAFAQAGRRTLLIDGDMRRPGLTTLLGLRSCVGLSEVLRDTAAVEESVLARLQAAVMPNLDILPCGNRPANPAELLSSQRLTDLLSWAGTRYEQIVIDSPPAPLASDTVIWGRLAHGVILVLQPETNKRRAVLRVAQYLAILKIPLLGVVINRVGNRSEKDYAGYGGDYYGQDPSKSGEKSRVMVPEGNDSMACEESQDKRITPRKVA